MRWQATLTVLVVVVVSLPVGVAVGATVYRLFADNLGARPGSVFPLGWLVLVLVGVLALANVVSAIPGWRASRVSPSQLLTESR